MSISEKGFLHIGASITQDQEDEAMLVRSLECLPTPASPLAFKSLAAKAFMTSRNPASNELNVHSDASTTLTWLPTDRIALAFIVDDRFERLDQIYKLN